MRGRGFFYSMLFRVQLSCFFAGVFLSLTMLSMKVHSSSPMWVAHLILTIVFLRLAQVSTRKLRRQVPQISEVRYSD